MKNNKIAVLITCHNRKIKTLSCFELLAIAATHVKYFTFDIYLVDDNSTDGTKHLVKNKFPQVKIIQGDGNLYWNRGMYTAWKEASKVKYQYFLWLNDDTLLSPESISELIRGAEKTNHNSIIIGSTYSLQNKLITYGGFNKKNQLIQPNTKLQRCEYFNGNCTLIPQNVFNVVGNLDKHFHHSLGDFDYGLRARKLGIDSYVIGSYVGSCEPHNEAPNWRNPRINIYKRIIALYKPLGNNPIEFFRFDFRHNGPVKAVFHFFSIHLRVIFPQLWHNRNK